MAINTSLLVAAPMLQDLLVDKATGLPLAQGVITLYKDNSRTTLKNWYYQSGTPGAYTYITLPNPLTLSAVGTITDVNGNDTIPFYYPYSEDDNLTPEPYYIVVQNSQSTTQFTRQNFPFVPTSPANSQVPTLRNLLINQVFWRNIGTVNVSQLATVLAPSQHDGFSMPDIQYIRNTNDAVDAITFNKFVGTFTDQILPNAITPEYYMQVQCTGLGTETSKYVQIPICLHVDSLSGADVIFTINARNVPGQVNNQFTVSVLQYLGTGVTSPATIVEQTITTSDSWQRYTVTFALPSAQGQTLGVGGDDALYLQIGFPVGKAFGIQLAMPGLYLGNTAPTTDFVTYDQVDSVTSTPRTGDIKLTMNTFNNDSIGYGWIAMDDGTIGSPSSGATNRANKDAWPLYNVLWNSVADAFAPVSGGRGASAIADFTANKTIALTKQLGRLIAGIGTPSSGTNTGINWALGQTTGNEQYKLVANDLPAHTHQAPAGGNFVTNGPANNVYSNVGANAGDLSNSTGNNATTNQFVNLQNPVVYYKILMKL